MHPSTRIRRVGGRLTLALGALFLLGGCATKETQHRDWSDYQGPGAKYFHEEDLTFWGINDPGEPTNRVLDDGVHLTAEYVVAPLATGWRFITPKGFRTALTRVGHNLLYPIRDLGSGI